MSGRQGRSYMLHMTHGALLSSSHHHGNTVQQTWNACLDAAKSAVFYTGKKASAPGVLCWCHLVCPVIVALQGMSAEADGACHASCSCLPHHAHTEIPEWVNSSNGILNDVVVQRPLHPMLWVQAYDCTNQQVSQHEQSTQHL